MSSSCGARPSIRPAPRLELDEARREVVAEHARGDGQGGQVELSREHDRVAETLDIGVGSQRLELLE
jgi:hypothetical protein